MLKVMEAPHKLMGLVLVENEFRYKPAAKLRRAVRKAEGPTPVKECQAFQLPLLGSNQDSPDPEGPP